MDNNKTGHMIHCSNVCFLLLFFSFYICDILFLWMHHGNKSQCILKITLINIMCAMPYKYTMIWYEWVHSYNNDVYQVCFSRSVYTWTCGQPIRLHAMFVPLLMETERLQTLTDLSLSSSSCNFGAVIIKPTQRLEGVDFLVSVRNIRSERRWIFLQLYLVC